MISKGTTTVEPTLFGGADFMASSEFLVYCFANVIDPDYKFIEVNENGRIKLFKQRTDGIGVDFDPSFFNKEIFKYIPVNTRCSLHQVLNGYKIGTGNRSFCFPTTIYPTYPYNLFVDIFKTDQDKFSLIMSLPMTEDRQKGLDYALDTLILREREVIQYYYAQEDSLSMEEVGKIIGVTRCRIQQILSKAVRKLRHPTRSIYILKGYEIASGELRKKIFDLRQSEIDEVNILIDNKIEQLKNTLNRPATELLNSRLDQISINELNLSVRSMNCLLKAGITTLSDLSKITKSDLVHMRNLGRKSLNEIIFKLKEFGIELEDGDLF